MGGGFQWSRQMAEVMDILLSFYYYYFYKWYVRWKSRLNDILNMCHMGGKKEEEERKLKINELERKYTNHV